MIEINQIEVFNLQNAMRGMRNPLESWGDGDTIMDGEIAALGEKDAVLAKKLILAGSDHSKFMRQIFVSMDITAPLYFFKEFDTYKVATAANSCSTMHKLATTPITREMFSFDEDLNELGLTTVIHGNSFSRTFNSIVKNAVEDCEWLRIKYLETKDIRYWRALIQMLPSSWNQKRTWTANYATLRNIYFARKSHKLTEWIDFCQMIENLPYSELIILEKGEKV